MKRALAGNARRYAEALGEYARVLEHGTPEDVGSQHGVVSELLDTFGALHVAVPAPRDLNRMTDAPALGERQ